MQKPLRRSSRDKVLAGVCGGIAGYLDISSLAVRLIFIIISPSILLYVILAFFYLKIKTYKSKNRANLGSCWFGSLFVRLME